MVRAAALLGAKVASAVKICSTAPVYTESNYETLVAAIEAAFNTTADKFDALPSKAVAILPDDDAFAAALSELNLTASELLADGELLTSILLEHVANVTDDGVIGLGGNELTFLVDGEEVPLEDAISAENVTIKGAANEVEAIGVAVKCIGGNQVHFQTSGVLLPPGDAEADAEADDEEKPPGASTKATAFAAVAMAAIMGVAAL